MKTKIKASDKSGKDQLAQSAFQYNPIYQKLTKLSWNAPSGGYHYYGPPPDMGTSYGMWWDPENKFGVLAPAAQDGVGMYSPASGQELTYEGVASADAVYALMNYKGAYEFLPPTRTGDTCLTTAPIFSPDVVQETLFYPFSGADLTQEYQTMKANRTAQPADIKPKAPVSAASTKLKEGLGADPHKSSEKGADIKKNDDPYKSAKAPKSRQPASELKEEVIEEAHKQLTAKIIDAMTEEELSGTLMSMLSKAAEGDDPPAEKSAPPPAEKSPPAKSQPAEAPPADAPPAEAPPAAPEEAPPADAPPADAPPEEVPPPVDEPAETAPEAPPADAPPPAEAPPQAPPPASPPVDDTGTAPPPEAPAPEVPSVQKEEPPTPTTKETQGVESMTMSAKAKEMKTLALKLLSDPEYINTHAAQVEAMVKEANSIVEAAKNGKEGSKGFYNKTQNKALDEAQKKTKPDGNGFYSDHMDEVREKTLKEIDKVSAMLDEKILAALGDMDDTAPPVMAKPPMVEEPMVEEPMPPEAEGDAWNLQGNEEMSMSPEEMDEMGAAMAAIEKALSAMGAKSKSPMKSKSKSKSKSKPKSKSEKSAMDKSGKSGTAEADFDQLKAEIDQLEASLNSANATEAVPPAAPAAPVAPVAPEAAPAAEGVAVELISSATELESDGPIAAASVQMSLFGETGINPFYNIVAKGEPVGRVYLQDQADPDGDRAFFTSAKYVQGVSQAIEKVGLVDTLTSISAKFFANRIERSEVVQKLQGEADKVIKATVAQKTATLRDELVDRMLVAQSALDKNMFKEEGNALKDAMFMQMQKFGVQNPVPYIEAAFEQGSHDYFSLILAKAIEYLDMEPKAFEQIKKTVANSDVLPTPVEGNSNTTIAEAQYTTLASHLSANNMPITFTHDSRVSSFADLKNDLRMGLSLKKTI